MIVKAFRFTGTEGQSSFYGIAAARDMRGIFWAIDEHGDPYSCEIKSVTKASICFESSKNLDDLSEDTDSDLSIEIDEIGGELLDAVTDKDGWRTPDWEGFSIYD